jgi:hypothetical protein
MNDSTRREIEFENQKPMLLLQAIARAYDMNIDAGVYTRHGMMYYYFSFQNGENVISDPVCELSENMLTNVIEAEISLEEENFLLALKSVLEKLENMGD